MSGSLGSAVLDLTTDNSKLEAGLERGHQSAVNWGKAAGLAVVGVTAALGAIGVASVSAAATFEQTMSGIKAVSGATADELKQISSLAMQLGKDTVYSAAEAGAERHACG